MWTIDSHHHFWKFDQAEYEWIEEGMTPLRQDFLCPELGEATSGLELEGAVSVQARTRVEETDFLLREGKDCPLVKGVVGWAPLKDAAVGECLDRWGSDPLFCGVREICQGAPDDEFFENDAFNRGIGELTRREVPYELLLYENQLETVIRFVDRHPEQRFIVDHIAKPVIRLGAFPANWAKGLRELGQREQVVGCKFSGVVTEVRDEKWDEDLLRPYFDAALNAFGAQRLMFGSDWPVCLLRSSYKQWIGSVREFLSHVSASQQRAILAENAIRVYGLQW
jgi:L-fuconolactonase